MAAFRRVVVGFDLTAEDEGLLNALPALRAWGIEELILTHVVSDSLVPILHRRDPTLGVGGKLSEAETRLRWHFRVQLCIRRGDPAACLIEEAGARAADGIVLGMKPAGPLRQALLGDTLTDVVRATDLPILLYPYASVQGGSTRPILSPGSTRLLLPLDLAEPVDRPLAFAGKLAAAEGLSVSLLHVLEGDEVGEDRARADLQSLANKLQSANVADVEVLVERGEPWERILARARELEQTLVVMGIHARRALSGFILGSQCREVARRSELPLVLIPG